MTKLFERTLINGMSVSNRFIRSATWEGLADKDGSVTPKLIEMMVELAKGEVGLIISSYTFVSPAGKSGPGQLAIYDDRFLPGLKEMVKAVHSAGGKIALQIVHGGIFANSELTGLELIGPSAGEKNSQPTCRPMRKGKYHRNYLCFHSCSLKSGAGRFRFNPDSRCPRLSAE